MSDQRPDGPVGHFTEPGGPVPRWVKDRQIAHLRALEEDMRQSVSSVADSYGGVATNVQEPLHYIAEHLVRLPFGDALEMAEEICKQEEYSASKPMDLAQALNKWAKAYTSKRR